MSPRPPTVELAPLSEQRAGVIAILEHYLARARSGDVVGLMVFAETEDGVAELKQSAAFDAYGRRARIDSLRDLVTREIRRNEETDES